MAVKDYSTNPDENTTISGINIAEGCPPSGINNAIRQLMADVKQNADEQDSNVMTGATETASGTAGLAPAPAAGDQNKPLTGGGKYADNLDCAVSRLYSEYLNSDMKDTKEWWIAKGNSIFCINIDGLINNQPSKYGTIINTVTGNEIQQLFLVQPNGDVYKRGANSIGWNGSADDDGKWKRLSNSMPIGAIYVQFSGQSSPSELFGGTWSNVSSSYAGLFFRAEGGSAAAFGKTQSDGAPDIHGQGIYISGSVGSDRGAFAASETYSEVGGYGSNNRNVTRLKFRASSHNSIYGRAKEIRTANSTIRIWKRAA